VTTVVLGAKRQGRQAQADKEFVGVG